MQKYFYPIFKLPTFYERDYVKEELPLWIKWWLLGKAGRKLSEILTGSEFTLLNTVARKFKILQIKGNTEQEQLTGKNLYNNNAEITRFYYNDSGQLVEGSNGDTFINTVIENNIDAHYTISYKERIGTTPYVRFAFFNGDTFISRTLLTNNNNYVNVPANTTKIDIRTDKRDTKYFVDLQIQEGTVATSYEPYCGGIPSPNPEYPQPIKNVTGNANVKIQNKNMFDKNNANVIEGYVTSTTQETILSNGPTNKGIWLKVKPNTTYTISRENSSTNVRLGVASTVLQPATGVAITNAAFNNNTTPLTITTGANDNYLFVYLWTASSSLTIEQTLNTVQIEQGTTATSYVPHQEQNLSFTLGDIELNKIDTAQDYFYKENNKWYLHKEVGIKKSNFDWLAGNPNNPNVYYSTSISDYAISNNIPICNYFKGIANIISESVMVGKTNQIAFISDRNYIRLYVNTSLTAEQLNALDLELYYKLYQPTNTEITDTTLIEQLETTLQARSYDDITYISSESDELPPLLDIQYWKERGV